MWLNVQSVVKPVPPFYDIYGEGSRQGEVIIDGQGGEIAVWDLYSFTEPRLNTFLCIFASWRLQVKLTETYIWSCCCQSSKLTVNFWELRSLTQRCQAANQIIIQSRISTTTTTTTTNTNTNTNTNNNNNINFKMKVEDSTVGFDKSVITNRG